MKIKGLVLCKLLTLLLVLVLVLGACMPVSVPTTGTTSGTSTSTSTVGGGNVTTTAPSGGTVTTTPQGGSSTTTTAPATPPVIGQDGFNYSEVPPFSGDHYAIINGNVPYFAESELTTVAFERYSNLDSLGRVGVAYACLGRELMPTGSNPGQSYKPTGWVQKTYPSTVVKQQQIYNRSHLIAWSLAGESNNEKNLMTGTPFFNQLGMQIFETQLLSYIRETGNHVMYRVTPVFVGNELVARGALMEGYSVEDGGRAICFCVFMYNVQPGIYINYATGDNWIDNGSASGSGSGSGSGSPGGSTGTAPVYANSFDAATLDGSSPTSYSERRSQAGWVAKNAAVIKSSTYAFLGQDTTGVVLNGKSSAKGSLTSPTLAGGISVLTFGYGFPFSDTQFSLTVNVKQNGVVVDTVTIVKTGLSSGTGYTYEWELDQAIEGNFQLEFINNAKSGASGNKDRLALYGISWE